MKTKVLSIIAFFVLFNIHSQSYQFSHTQGTYTPLTEAVTLNTTAWLDQVYNIPLPFTIEFFGDPIKDLEIENGNIFASSLLQQNIYYDITPATGTFIDPGYFVENRISQSPLKYKVEGPDGDRILKIEINNIASAVEWIALNTLNMRINYQVWIYETSNKIEIHYGNNSITDFDIFFNLPNSSDDEVEVENSYRGFLTVAIAKEEEIEQGEELNYTLSEIIYLTGTADNPTVSTDIEFLTSQNFAELTLMSSYPVLGKIYTYTPQNLSTNNPNITPFSVYPNPTENHITIVSKSNIQYNNFVVLDILGKEVISGKLPKDIQTIDLSNLESGIYFIKIDSNRPYKLIKQ